MNDVDGCGSEILDKDDEDTDIWITPESSLNLTISLLNNYRIKYLNTKDKKWWWQLIQLLPQSYNQKRTISMNYEAVYNMYQQRKNHKLDEWHDFCNWAESLPYFKELFLEENG